MKLLLIDNYDSFTYNLVHFAEPFVKKTTVIRNDKINLEEVNNYDAILISPGPGLSKDAGITIDLIKTYVATKRILGVCLGHQIIAEIFGTKLINMPCVKHGETVKTIVTDNTDKLFKEIPITFDAARYHSWVIDKNTLPDCLKITAIDEEEQIMAISHRTFDLRGVQFHPESIMTKYGKQILKNWIIDKF